jgi:transcriptional regulator with XRE-family HTH domain
MTINEKIGQRILVLRKAQKLSQEALAHKSDVDRTYMTGVETGKRNVTVKVLEKIIYGLDCDFATFFNDKSFDDGKKEN